MIRERITDPIEVSTKDIETIVAKGRVATIQFSDPGYDERILGTLNDLCGWFGSQIEIRFFGHYFSDFDASVLTYLPNVMWLSLDCLQTISNEDAIRDLEHLSRLSFGVFEFDRPSFLGDLPMEQFDEHVLAETRKRNFDLSPLHRCENLTDLFIEGHTKSIEAVAQAPKLRDLRLRSLPKRQDLAFLCVAPALMSLELMLGGRRSIDELHHDRLADLRVIRVRGLETLGNLERFPSLRRVHIEDQLRLREVSFAGLKVHDVKLINCKNLSQVHALSEQTEMVGFRCYRTALDLDSLLEFDWPASVEVLGLYSGRTAWDDAAQKRLAERGYREFS